MFGGSKTTFGAPASSAFGQTSGTLFGSTAGQNTSIFGQATGGIGSSTPALFGGPTQTNTMSWGGTAAIPGVASGGTSIPFNPPIAPDTLQRAGQSTQVNAKHMCITAMKEYQDKSLEELRAEDYALNRQNGPGATTSTSSSLFGASTAVKPFQFGAAQTTGAGSIFGQTSKPSNTLFGGSGLTFGAATTTVSSVFGQPAQSQSGILGLKPPFGATSQPTNLFGTAPAAQPSGFSFGQTSQTGSVFGTKPLFGAPSYGNTASTGLFGTAQPSATATPSGFTFGQTQQTTGLGGTTGIFGQNTAAKPNLFGAQPATSTVLPFGSSTANVFGAPKTTGITLFGSSAPGLTAGQTQQTGFGFGALKPTGTTGLFGSPAASTTKPGGIFGVGAPTSTTAGFGFGTGLSTGQPTAFGDFGSSAATSNAGLFGQPTANSLAAKKTFDFGSSLTNQGASSAPSIFGFGQTSQPTGLFGTGTSTGALGIGLGSAGSGTGTLFGQQTGFGIGAKPAAPGGFGTGFGLGNTGLGTSGLGSGNLFGSTTSAALGSFTSTTQSLGLGGLGGFGTLQPGQIGGALTGLANNSAIQAAQSVRAQQQVLELVRSMPYGQSPLFRYINLPTTSECSNEVGTRQSSDRAAPSATGASMVIPAKAAVTALAERHKAAGLALGIVSPGSIGSSIPLDRGMWPKSRAVTQRLLQLSNRSKLFSGLHEDDILLSPSNQAASPALRLRRSATLSADVVLSDSPRSGSQGAFFVRRDEWKRLHLPENLRNSIVERSVAASRDTNRLLEASMCGDREPEPNLNTIRSDEASTSPELQGVDGDTPGHSVITSVVSIPVSVSSVNAISGLGRGTAWQRNSVSSVSGAFGFRQAKEALQVGTADDSILHEDLESTWTSPSGISVENSSALGIVSPSPWNQQTHKSPRDTASSVDSVPPNGVKLTKPGYYTLPTPEELSSMIDADGRCIVEDFVIGRRHYGHILFPGDTDVTGLDLDDIVHIRRREVVIYPDDVKKPPVGFGLNKRAEVCLESIWPTDKATREPIKSPERLSVMRFEERLERATRRMDAKFIEYRPESGSWVFEVKHFSKYRLEDSDDDDAGPAMKTSTDDKGDSVSMELDSQLCLETSEKFTHVLQKSVAPLKIVSESISAINGGTHLTHLDVTTLDQEWEQKSLDSGDESASTMVIEDSMRTTPRALRQMRDAFFNPSITVAQRSHRSALFGQSNDYGAEEIDEATDFDAPMEETETALVWSNSITAKRSQRLSKLTDEMSYDKPNIYSSTSRPRAQEPYHFGPSPKKIVRTLDEPATIRSKQEGPGQITRVKSTTPFHPIRYEKFSDGVPLSRKRIPPVTARLHLARLSNLLNVERTLSDEHIQLVTQTYPYDYLSRFYSGGNVSAFQISESAAVLSRLLLDVGLWRGHGMRVSWGQTRSLELHSVGLVTAGSATNSPNPPSSSRTSFQVSISCWSSFVNEADEHLLNGALLTSVCSTEGDPNPQSLCPPSDHCPLWQPTSGLGPLEAYSRVLRCEFPDAIEPLSQDSPNARMMLVRRLMGLCCALWGQHPQESTAATLLKKDADFEANVPNGAQDCNDMNLDSFDLASDEKTEADSPANDLNLESDALRRLARKQAISEWIRAQSYPWLLNQLSHLNLLHVCQPRNGTSSDGSALLDPPFPLSKKVSADDVGKGIFYCLLAGEPGAACRLALAACMPNLASLLAHSSASDPLVRRGLQRQLVVWHDLKYDQHIPLNVLCVYALLAGQSVFPHPKQSQTDVFVLENVDWIRAFGAYLWYMTDYSSDVADVISAYSSAWHSSCTTLSAVTIPRPIPPKLCDLVSPPLVSTSPTDFPPYRPRNPSPEFRSWPRDTAYHLLQLFCKGPHSLERTLDPCSVHQQRCARTNTCTADPSSLLDWAPSWHVWRVLHALGYRHFASPNTLSRICHEFAAQLEDGGLWEWAVFVLLHLRDQTMRDACVKSVVTRHATLVLPPRSKTSQASGSFGSLDVAADRLNELSLAPPPPFTRAENFIIKLGVPARWVHEAKAVLAHHRFLGYHQPFNPTVSGLSRCAPVQLKRAQLQARLFAILEAAHWLAADHIAAAHEVCISYLLPDLVLRTNRSFGSSNTAIPLTPGQPSSVSQLGHRLQSLLQPFRSLSVGLLPDDFATGVGLYIRYSDILILSERLGELWRHRSSGTKDEISETAHADRATEIETQAQLAVVLNSLQSELDTFTESLQHMQVPNLKARVVKTEMAIESLQLVSAFLAVTISDTRSDPTATLDRLRHQLLAMTKIHLPADICLKELSSLSEIELSMGVV
ncbi:unnamed protein product [Dicrocoelium dendriticum]|nr:unnamed protein product [Dicrocoelium dendriticum]